MGLEAHQPPRCFTKDPGCLPRWLLPVQAGPLLPLIYIHYLLHWLCQLEESPGFQAPVHTMFSVFCHLHHRGQKLIPWHHVVK